MASLPDTSDTSGRLIAASKVSGTSVYNTAGEKLGSVYDVMLEKVSGKAEYAVLSFGGFLGIGEKYHPLPWHELTHDTGQGGYVVKLGPTKLEAGPSYAASELHNWDDTRGRAINSYYGTPPGYSSVTGSEPMTDRAGRT
jgi:sporulation protein YlmC with PRC-barrel domain